MRNMLASLTFVVAGYVLACAQRAILTPEQYKTEFDNDKVHVVRAFHAPREKVPMHSHPTAVVVYLTDVHERSTAPSGIVKEVTHNAGDVVWSPAHSHTLENLSEKPIEVIEIELKPIAGHSEK